MAGYPDDIEVYKDAIDEILSWMPDWLNQDEFDKLVTEKAPLDRRVRHYTGETVMLHWSNPHLDLLQSLQRHKLVDARDGMTGVEYKSKVTKSD